MGASPTHDAPGDADEKLPKTVVGLGFVSLFTDMSSEAIFPLLPVFLTALGASNAFIGVVEGSAELVANLLKYLSGIAADRLSRLKPLVLVGYGISTVVRPLVAFAATPWQVLAARVGDRVGKGVRTSPRDALIATATQPSIRARAYGFHRAMDHTGAALGTVLGIGVLWAAGASPSDTASPGQLRTVFLWAALPGVLAMIALAVTREPPRQVPAQATSAQSGPTPAALRRALLPIALFAFANATDAFIIVKATRLGAPTLLAPLLWLTLHIIKGMTATAGGRLADRYGRREALALGWAVYALTWGAVGLTHSIALLFFLTALYGTSHGLVEGAERALVAELAGDSGKGRAFGLYNMLVGFAALAASATFGLVWDRFGSAMAFAGSGAIALAAAGLLLVRVSGKPADGDAPARRC
jgi:MFS family permease